MGLEIHTIPVPKGWSIEQSWEAISRGEILTDPEPAWANVLVSHERLVRVVDDTFEAYVILVRDSKALTAKGFNMWLREPNVHLDGDSPLEALQEGRDDEVRAAAHAFSGGEFLDATSD